MPPDATATTETLQRRSLRRHKALATTLLLLMAALFLALRAVPEPGFWLLLARAGAEAALVGGLADWFAVTALFRHPLGLPIPHTALIPRNKDRIGAGLGAFVERNFLAPELVAQKLRSLDLASRLGAWLVQRRNAEAVADRIVATLPFLLSSVRDRELRAFVGRALREQLESVDLAPLLAKVLRILSESRHHQALFDQGLRIARRLLLEYQPRIYEKVSERSKWWVPAWVDREIAEKIVLGIAELLDDLSQPESEARHRFDQALAGLIDNLEHSPQSRETVERIKTQVLLNPAVQDYLGSVADELRRMLEQDVAAPDSRLRGALVDALRALGRGLAGDESVRERLNRRIETVVSAVVVPWRAEIGGFIAEVVRQWDARTVTERIELEVGRDLQFVRINGTVVGALVGCLLFLLSAAMP